MIRKFSMILVFLAAALIFFCWARSKIRKGERIRYDETVAMMNGFTTGPVGVGVFTNVLYDAWGRIMTVTNVEDEWLVVSQGQDQSSRSDDIILRWNPRFARMDIHYEYDGTINDYGRNEEHE